MSTTTAWAAADRTAPLAPIPIERREVGPSDVEIEIAYCGICHSDLHTVRNDWRNAAYPVVPGHEIVGRVVAVGGDVTRFGVGDLVGVGCLVDSCGECAECRDGLQNYCTGGAVLTYNSVDPHGTAPRTYGGYSGRIVVTESFVLSVPDGLDPAAAAPILCAGITVYSPLRHHGVGPGTRVGVVGFGGLGGMAVKIAKALGAEVTVLTRSEAKADDARKAGADRVVVTSDGAQLKEAARSLELIVNTIPVSHDLNPYLQLLVRDGKLVLLGAIEPLREPVHGGLLMRSRLSVTGSLIGGLAETQEVLDFCASHRIAADVRVIGVDAINAAYADLAAGDPGYRYVIDLSTLSPEPA